MSDPRYIPPPYAARGRSRPSLSRASSQWSSVSTTQTTELQARVKGTAYRLQDPFETIILRTDVRKLGNHSWTRLPASRGVIRSSPLSPTLPASPTSLEEKTGPSDGLKQIDTVYQGQAFMVDPGPSPSLFDLELGHHGGRIGNEDRKTLRQMIGARMDAIRLPALGDEPSRWMPIFAGVRTPVKLDIITAVMVAAIDILSTQLGWHDAPGAITHRLALSVVVLEVPLNAFGATWGPDNLRTASGQRIMVEIGPGGLSGTGAVYQDKREWYNVSNVDKAVQWVNTKMACVRKVWMDRPASVVWTFEVVDENTKTSVSRTKGSRTRPKDPELGGFLCIVDYVSHRNVPPVAAVQEGSLPAHPDIRALSTESLMAILVLGADNKSVFRKKIYEKGEGNFLLRLLSLHLSMCPLITYIPILLNHSDSDRGRGAISAEDHRRAIALADVDLIWTYAYLHLGELGRAKWRQDHKAAVRGEEDGKRSSEQGLAPRRSSLTSTRARSTPRPPA